VSLIVVETSREGFQRGRMLEKLGLKAQDTSELFFTGVRVPIANRLGRKGAGFKMAMHKLAHERLIIAVNAVATCEAVLEWTVTYTGSERPSASGSRSSRTPASRWRSSRRSYRVCVSSSIGASSSRSTTGSTAPMRRWRRWWRASFQCRLVDECLQFFGGYGYTLDYPIAHAYIDARVRRIAGGSSEVMREIISRKVSMAERRPGAALNPRIPRGFQSDRRPASHRRGGEEDLRAVPRRVLESQGHGSGIPARVPRSDGGGRLARHHDAGGTRRLELGVTEAAVMMNTVASGNGGSAAMSTLQINLFAPHPIVVLGTPEQKQRMLRPLISGSEKTCFGVTEANAGLNTTQIKTFAKKVDGGYLVNGSKIWTSTAQIADNILLLTRTTAIRGLREAHRRHDDLLHEAR
jgi:alkylation response protein AidB-like acyl-CoA dehydrogenase